MSTTHYPPHSAQARSVMRTLSTLAALSAYALAFGFTAAVVLGLVP